MSERLHYSVTRSNHHAVSVSTTQVDGEWWVQTSVDGRVLAYECIGPVDEVHPPEPLVTREDSPSP